MRQAWVLRLSPTDRQLSAPSRTWEQDRVVAYIAQYTKEMAASHEVIRMLSAMDQQISGCVVALYETAALPRLLNRTQSSVTGGQGRGRAGVH